MSKIDESPARVQDRLTASPSGAPQLGPEAGLSPASAGAPAAARETRTCAARAHISTARAASENLLELLNRGGSQQDAYRLMRRALVNLHYACEELLLPAAAEIIDQGVA